MNLHEYQAKALFQQYGIPVPRFSVIDQAEQAATTAADLGGSRWVAKAQVHAGGRGKAGGVRVIDNTRDLQDFTRQLMGTRLVTHQTGAEGQPIHQVLIEQPCDIARELYLGALVDRQRECVVFMASAAGGMDIEEVARSQPEKILTVAVNPAAGLQGYQCRQLAFGLGLGTQVKVFSQIMSGLYRLFIDKDISLLEINPLVVTTAGELLAIDAKINIDDNGLYRQKAIAELRDMTQEDEKECRAREHDLNYISLEGDIACMVNGAGLAMATMDIIKLHGGEPANFLDVGGGTTAARVAEAFKLIMSDSKVKAILVNIFGGIVRCDLIAEGIIQAVKEVDMSVPVVVRLEGTNVEQGKKLLAESGLAILAADDLDDAAKQAVNAARG